MTTSRTPADGGLERFFHLRERQSDVRTEVLGGLTTFFVMAYSITNGIGAGFILYTFLHLAGGRKQRLHPLMYVVSLAFLIYFLIPFLQQQLG